MRYEELDEKSKKIALRNLKKGIQQRAGIKIGIQKALLMRIVKYHEFSKNGEME